MDILKLINAAALFLLEIAMLAAFAGWGFSLKAHLFWRWVAGIGAPVIVIILWSIWFAPTADQRLTMPWLIIAKAGIFGLAALGLYMSGKKTAALSLIGAFILIESLAVAWGQELPSAPGE